MPTGQTGHTSEWLAQMPQSHGDTRGVRPHQALHRRMICAPSRSRFRFHVLTLHVLLLWCAAALVKLASMQRADHRKVDIGEGDSSEMAREEEYDAEDQQRLLDGKASDHRSTKSSDRRPEQGTGYQTMLTCAGVIVLVILLLLGLNNRVQSCTVPMESMFNQTGAEGKQALDAAHRAGCPTPLTAACPPSIVPTAVECPQENITASYHAVLALEAQAASAAVLKRTQAIHGQHWFCRLDSWILGEWTPDGHTFIPHSLKFAHPTPYLAADLEINLPLASDHSRYHIYNSAEAQQCMRHRKLKFVGPSYLRDVVTSIFDLLSGRPLRVGYKQMNPEPLDHAKLGPGFEQLELVTVNGMWRDWTKLEEVLERIAHQDYTICADNLIWDVNKLSIDLHHGSRQMAFEVYFMNLRRFLVLCERHGVSVIWMTQMSLQKAKGSAKVDQFREAQTDAIFLSLLDRTVALLEEFDVPWLDVFHMTQTCVTDPSDTDPTQTCDASMHSNWYVAMFKAQMLLNYLCRGCEYQRSLIPKLPRTARRAQEVYNDTWLTPSEWS